MNWAEVIGGNYSETEPSQWGRQTKQLPIGPQAERGPKGHGNLLVNVAVVDITSVKSIFSLNF